MQFRRAPELFDASSAASTSSWICAGTSSKPPPNASKLRSIVLSVVSSTGLTMNT